MKRAAVTSAGGTVTAASFEKMSMIGDRTTDRNIINKPNVSSD